MMSGSHERALLDAEVAFNEAMCSNNVDRIRECVTPDWLLVIPERGPIVGEELLSLIEKGVLGHHSMKKQPREVRVFGKVGIVTGRGQNTGWFHSQEIRADEWITDVYRLITGRWLCELTHLTPVSQNRQF